MYLFKKKLELAIGWIFLKIEMSLPSYPSVWAPHLLT